MRELFKKTFDLWVRTRWLKEIDKATKQYQNAKSKAEIKRYVLCKLLDAYRQKYNVDLKGDKNG